MRADRPSTDPPPAPSAEVALEVALLSSQEHVVGGTAVALVVASNDDERSYVSEVLRQRSDMVVVAVATIAAALEAASRQAPRVIVAAHDDRAVVRHLPVVPAVLLSDDATVARGLDVSRLAPMVVLRGGFGDARLLHVVASLIGDQETSRDD